MTTTQYNRENQTDLITKYKFEILSNLQNPNVIFYKTLAFLQKHTEELDMQKKCNIS